MPTGYSYARFSDPTQANGRSEARQDTSAEKWCAENGYTLEPLKPDRGRSAYHGEHLSKGHLGIFLAMAKAGLIKSGSALIVEKLDRYTRQDPYTGMGTFRALMDAGIDLVITANNKKYNKELLMTDPMASIEIQFNLFQSHEESSKKAMRLKDVWEAKRTKARAGETVTQRRPAWINKDNSVDQEKADVIRRIYRLAADGKGAKAITRIFNEENVKPIKGAKHWSTGLIKYYLSTRTVIGELQFSKIVARKATKEGEAIKGFYPAIVDADLWQAVQRQLIGRKKHEIKGRVDRFPNLFTRLIHNLYDNSTYFYKEMNKKQKDAFGEDVVYHTKRLASTKAEDNRAEAMKIALDYTTFEEAFMCFVKELNIETLFATTDKTSKAEELETLNAALVDIDEVIRDATAAFNTSKNRSRWSKIIDENETKRQEMMARIEILRSELTTSHATVMKDMNIMDYVNDPDCRAKIASQLRMIVERIEVLPIHIRDREHRKVEYILYVEVVFANEQRRFFVLHNGTEYRDYWMEMQQCLQPGTNIHFWIGFDYNWGGYSEVVTPELRQAVLTHLTSLASPKWLPRLKEWMASQ